MHPQAEKTWKSLNHDKDKVLINSLAGKIEQWIKDDKRPTNINCNLSTRSP